MVELVITGLDEKVVERLHDSARRHGRTLQAEAKKLLEQALAGTNADWERVDEIRERLATSGRTFGDSAELLREDRDR